MQKRNTAEKKIKGFMKKGLVLGMVAMMAVSATACGGNDSKKSDSKSSTSTSSDSSSTGKSDGRSGNTSNSSDSNSDRNSRNNGQSSTNKKSGNTGQNSKNRNSGSSDRTNSSGSNSKKVPEAVLQVLRAEVQEKTAVHPIKNQERKTQLPQGKTGIHPVQIPAENPADI